VVSITGSGFAPGATVFLVECRAGPPDDTGRACDVSKTLKGVSARDNGTVETTFTVRRTLNTSLYGTIDCTMVAEGCILGWGGSETIDRGNVPLAFATDDAAGGLPRTGGETMKFAAWGALALVAGVLVRVASRRRRGTDVLPD
jgi:LPXTG-motif cell wall-anchored protein